MISMDEYVRSLEKLEIRKGKSDEALTREEIKPIRSVLVNLIGLLVIQDLICQYKIRIALESKRRSN